MKQNIFNPLTMTRTSLLSVNPADSNLAVGYKSPHYSKWEKAPHASSSFIGAGGIISTAADLCKWDKALYTEEILCKSLLKELFNPVISGYAMGWFIDGAKAYHGGDVSGFSSKILRNMDDKLLITLLSNFDGCRESNMGHYSDMVENLILPTVKI